MSTSEPQFSRLLFSKHWRQEVDHLGSSNTRKDTKDLVRMVQDLMYNIARRHNNHPNQTETLDWDLHDLWYTLICAASICDADGAEQGTLACYVIHAQELGGILESLQYLASDLEDFWMHTSDTLPPQHRQNLSAFTAILVALGVEDERLFSCGVSLLTQKH